MSGNVYIADTLYNTIAKFGPEGNFVKQWLKTGNDEGQFSVMGDFAMVANRDGYIYLTEVGNYLSKFDANGNLSNTLAQLARA